MSLSDVWKRCLRALARSVLFLLIPLFKILPYNCVRRMFRGMVALGFLCVRRKKANARESLAIAFGQEKTEKERARLLKESFFNIGQGMAELMYYTLHPAYITEKVRIEGVEHIRQAMAAGKGVVGMTAHLGNLPLMLYRLSAEEDFETSVIIRPSRDKTVERFFHDINTSRGLETIYSVPAKQSVVKAMKALRDNRLVMIPMDQNYGSAGGIYVDFFGKKAATAAGVVVFSLRTGAPILPIFTVRGEGDQHRVIVEPPYQMVIRDSDRETIEFNTAALTKKIEEYVRRYPHEWAWMHRRWKSRPPGETS